MSSIFNCVINLHIDCIKKRWMWCTIYTRCVRLPKWHIIETSSININMPLWLLANKKFPFTTFHRSKCLTFMTFVSPWLKQNVWSHRPGWSDLKALVWVEYRFLFVFQSWLALIAFLPITLKAFILVLTSRSIGDCRANQMPINIQCKLLIMEIWALSWLRLFLPLFPPAKLQSNPSSYIKEN